MNEVRLQRIAWTVAVIELLVLVVSLIIVIPAPDEAGVRYWEIITSAIAAAFAPVLGLVILQTQRNNRIGWLLLLYGALVSFYTLAQALYILEGGRPNMPSGPILVMLIISEITALSGLAFLGLLMLWFPDGRPPSPRWRFVQWWLLAAVVSVSLQIFQRNVPWTPEDGLGAQNASINNPIGFIPDQAEGLLDIVVPIGFFSIMIILVLAAVSVFFRYRSAGPLVRAQLQWFILGSLVYASIFVFSLALGAKYPGLFNLGVIAIYLAIGIAITRYRLYDIEVVIRRTLTYGALTVTLALVFLGAVTLLQMVFSAVSGQRSAIATVISTLLIAALFSPLRRRIQNDIDRRFYRKKYNAEQAIERFTAKARQETDPAALSAELLAVVAETMQPEKVTLWLKPIIKKGNQ